MLTIEFAKDLVKIAVQQRQASERFKKNRMKEIQKNEDLYMNKVQPALTGRFNVPLPIMSGFVDTLQSKIDDKISISFTHGERLAYLIGAKKVTSMWEKDSSPAKGNWAQVDRDAKKLATFSGRAIYRIYSESDPEYKNNFSEVDYYDFHCEPSGGADLEKHLFTGLDNIFKTRFALVEGFKAGTYYNPTELFNLTRSNDYRDNQRRVEERNNRFTAMGLDPKTNNYVGEEIINLSEWCLTYHGKRYYLLFDPINQIPVRAELLKDIHESNLWPYESWATHRDPAVFWSKAPCDDIRPVAEAMRIIFNMALDNLQKRNWGMKAVDPDVFPDLTEFSWRPDGIVLADAGKGAKMKSGIYEFQVNDTTGVTVNLMEFLDNYLGQKSGITAGAQGASDKETKVGVYYGDLQQVADRLGYLNKNYADCWTRLGVHYIWGLKEHMPQKMAVKIVGTSGIEWTELLRDELEPEYDIVITGGNAEMQQNEVKNKKREAALAAINSDPALAAKVNPDWRIKEILRTGEYTEEEMKQATDVSLESPEILSQADMAIEMILKGKTPKLYRNATLGFMKYLNDYAIDNDLEDDVWNKIIAYIERIKPVVMRNTVAAKRQAMMSATLPALNGENPPVLAPNPNVPGQNINGTAAQSQDLSKIAQPQM